MTRRNPTGPERFRACVDQENGRFGLRDPAEVCKDRLLAGRERKNPKAKACVPCAHAPRKNPTTWELVQVDRTRDGWRIDYVDADDAKRVGRKVLAPGYVVHIGRPGTGGRSQVRSSRGLWSRSGKAWRFYATLGGPAGATLDWRTGALAIPLLSRRHLHGPDEARLQKLVRWFLREQRAHRGDPKPPR